MAIEVFSRYEKKYVISTEVYYKLLKKLGDLVVNDPNSKGEDFYEICNLYYDTPTDELIRKSIEKPVYKEKLRLRSYGTPGMKDKVFLEIKKKYKGVVNKRRVVLSLEGAYDFIESKKMPEYEKINPQIAKEIEYFLNFHEVEPKLYLSYFRKALFGVEDKELRITFDKNIITRRYDLNLEEGSKGELLLEEGLMLMEIKASLSIPVWFCDIMSDLKIYPKSFSKYGTEYKNKIIKEGEETCLNQYWQHQQIQQFQLVQPSLVS